MALFSSSLRSVGPLVAAVLLLSACDKLAPPVVAPAPPPPPPVSVASAFVREVLEADEFPGRIEAIQTVAIRARVNGYLHSVGFEPGTEVVRGALLFVIDPRPFAARLAEAEAALADIQAQLELAGIELARHQQMLRDRATSRREFDAAAARVKSLQAGVRAGEATVESARLNLDYTRITAPIAGRVGMDEVTVGNLVQGENPDSPVLTTLVSVDPIYVTFEADERAYLKYITAAREQPLTVQVGLADEDDFPHEARLEFVDNQVDVASGTVRMRAVLDNAARRFTPGLFARVRLSATTGARSVVLVAERAIGTDQSKRFVLVVADDGIANYREVQIGRQLGNLRVIESGLAAGERIIVNGLQRVRPGSPVSATDVPMEAPGTEPVAADAG